MTGRRTAAGFGTVSGASLTFEGADLAGDFDLIAAFELIASVVLLLACTTRSGAIFRSCSPLIDITGVSVDRFAGTTGEMTDVTFPRISYACARYSEPTHIEKWARLTNSRAVRIFLRESTSLDRMVNATVELPV